MSVPVLFEKLDKLKPFYNWFYKMSMLLCKLLLVTEIIITSIVVFGRYVINKSPAWGEEVILTCMVYMTLLSAAMALRRGAHIRMTAMDRYLPKLTIKILDILSDAAIFAFSIILIYFGFKFALGIGGKGSFTSLPKVSKFWLYFPVPLSGIAMFVFEIEALYNHIKAFFVKEGEPV